MSLLIKRTGYKIVRNICNFSVPSRQYATRKRFYKSTGVTQSDNKWEITLDHRRLKTPNGRQLIINNEQLARAIAVEWDSQCDIISQPIMHLTALCNTALDNPGKLTTHDITSFILEYLATDTLLFQTDEEEELKTLQEKKWGPILDWFDKRFGVRLQVSHGLQTGTLSTDARAHLARHLLSYDFASLNALKFGIEALKSPVLMLACVERRLLPHEAVSLARLEEEYQISYWGQVPWAHELSQADLTTRVAAAVLVIHSNTEKYSTTVKKPPSEQTI